MRPLGYRRLGACVVLLLTSLCARADLTIEITQGVDDPVPLAVVPFGWDDVIPPPEDVGDIVRFDLARSGQFAMTAPEAMLSLPSQERDLFWRDWRIQGVSYVLIGRLEARDGEYRVHYGLYDVYEEARLAGGVLDGSRARLRDMAHEISDLVFEQLTGIRLRVRNDGDSVFEPIGRQFDRVAHVVAAFLEAESGIDDPHAFLLTGKELLQPSTI